MAEQRNTARTRRTQAPSEKPAPKAERLLALAAEHYQLRQSASLMPYAVRDGREYLFDGPRRQQLAADLRSLWRSAFKNEAPPGDLRGVLEDLRRSATLTDPDQPDAAEEAAAITAAAGISGQLGGWSVADAARAYEVRAGAIGWHRPHKDGGTLWTPLATFDAAITEEIIRDDGSEALTTWRMVVTAAGGATGTVEIPPDQLARPQQWAARAAGAAAIVMPGPLMADHLRVAVQSRSRPARRVVYAHTGWRLMDGSWRYLSASGALGAAGLDDAISVDLGSLSGFALPSVPSVREVRAAVRDSLALLEMAPDRVTAVWLGSVYRAPLPLAPDCANWLYGPSGTFKTEQTAVGQQHFGALLSAKALPGSWSSTGNDLEVTSHLLKDSLFVVDDYSPDATQIDARKRAAAADRLIRGTANQAGRGRLRPDGTRRPVKVPRAQILTSAEDAPPGVESMRARTFVTKVMKGDVDLVLLTTAQQAGAAGVYATATAAYIQSLARRYDASLSLPAGLVGTRDKYRDAAHSDGHPRCAVNIATLALGWHEFLGFAEDVGAITSAERAAYWTRAWAALCQVGREQESYRKDADPVAIYLSGLRGLLAAGRGHLAASDGGLPPEPVRWGWVDERAGREPSQWQEHEPEPLWRPRGDLLGWTDGTDLYFESAISYQAARRFAEDAGQPLTLSKRGLHEDLRERGLLASTGSQGKVASRIQLGGAQQTVVHMTVTTFDGAI